MHYKPASYSIGFQLKKEIAEAPPICVYRPNWFARVILRRKCRYMSLEEACARLQQAARETEEQLARSLFESGH